MNILLMDTPGSPAITLDANSCKDHWIWTSGKYTKFTAYFDLIFQADANGALKTTTDTLARRWNTTRDTAYKWLRAFKRWRLIDYAYKNRQLHITILKTALVDIPNKKGA